MTIYELTDEYRQLLEMLEDSEDLDPKFIQDTIEAVGGEIEVKADGYAKVMKELEATANGLKAEEERLHNRRQSIENNISRMKQALQTAMETTGKTKFKTDLFSFGIQKNPASAFIPDESKVPEQFRIPQPDKIDKKAIIDYLKQGNEADWAELTQGQSLRIR